MKATERRLLRFKKRLLTTLRNPGADFELYLVRNAQMEHVRRTLMDRKDFKGPEARKIAHEEMVNVLSFPEPQDFPHPESRGRHLGEVYLNLDFAPDAPERLESLMVHGVLHLLGYRHDRLRDTIKMEALEKKICRVLTTGNRR